MSTAAHNLAQLLHSKANVPSLNSAFRAAEEAVSSGVVDRETWVQTVEACVAALTVPTAFVRPLRNDEKSIAARTWFKQQAELSFGFVKVAIGSPPDKEALESVICPVLVACASFLGDEEGIWCCAHIRDKAQDLLTTLLSHHPRRLSTLISAHAADILTTHIKPFFTHQRVHDTGNRAVVTKQQEIENVWSDEQPGDVQLWKTERVDCVQVLGWVVLHLEHGQIAPIQHLLFPALLTLLDDHDPAYKTIGAQLTHHAIVKNSAPMDIRRTGLGDVFFNFLLPCLTYHSDPPLLRSALPCIVDLVPVIEIVGSEAYCVRLERVMQEGVLRGLSFAAGGKVEVLRTILQIIPDLVSRLGIITVRHLQSLLGTTTTLLHLHTHDTPTQLLAARAVLTLIREAWPRVAQYRGVVMKGVAGCWRGLGVEKTEGQAGEGEKGELRRLLREICVALREVCGREVEPDFRLLLRMNAPFYKNLVPIAA
ncbi:uncharacterized protein EV422DRAFT_225831 [Fimicolochytrium jonesii]|uniref:uncharacterized protein n=1 Tax=Fimicolochytrium jonesii TaxID=1396493 RepID=UPI0022FDF58C|nr:uncharacterized protein EV422DRAFT_225831 [Fimicolochytrium jonesii]KAI8817464.1 hypothetical protein EV422DRAFT_225831 [Fimicolochytrium jonesii]